MESIESTVSVKAPAYNAAGTIDCQLNHPAFGWIAYTASPDDTVEMGRQVHAALLAGAAGEIKPYDPSTVVRYVPQTVTRRQALLALLDAGLLDDLEASLSAINGALEKRKAQIEYDAPEWSRQNVWLVSVCEQIGMTSDDLDNLFITAETL